MQIRIYKNGNKVSSIDCVFETRTITFSSPAEYISALLNFDWYSFAKAYTHATINLDPAEFPKLSADFYQQFSLLSPKLRELIYSLFFADSTNKYFTNNLLKQYLSPEHKCSYCDLLHFDIPLTRDLNLQLSNFSANLHLLTLLPDNKYDYNNLCHTFNYVFRFSPITYPYASFAECFNIMEKWLYDNYLSTIPAYRKSLSKLLAAKEKNEFIDAIKEIKDIFASANLWETNDIFAEYLEYAQLPKYTTVQDLSLLFVDSFYRSLENYNDLSFRTAVASSLFSAHDLTSTNTDIYLCSSPNTFLLTSFLCCYKYNAPIAKCARCYKFFARSVNQQKICTSTSCQTPAIKLNRILSKELFGKDLYNKLTNAYKRLTYCKQTRDKNAYVRFGITSDSSKKLVNYFSDMMRGYNDELDGHISFAHKLSCECSPFLEQYIDLVNKWMDHIDSYYRKNEIGTKISQSLADDDILKNQRLVYIIEYHLDVESHGWEIYSVVKPIPVQYTLEENTH